MGQRISVGFGSSNEKDARKAGFVAANTAKESGKGADIAFVFSTIGYDPQQLLAGIHESLGEVPVHGGTSFTGIVTPAGFLGGEDDAVGVLTLSSAHLQFGTGFAELGSDPAAAGRTATEMALKQAGNTTGEPRAALMTSTPMDEEAVIRGITQVLGNSVPIVGGSAADNTVEGKWHVFANQTTMPSGVVVTVFCGDLPIGCAFGNGYHSTGKTAIATKASGRTIYELDGRKAVEVYADWTGQDAASLSGMSILGASILKPLAVYDTANDFYLVKHPGIAQEDGSIALFAGLDEGDAVVLMEATVDDLLAEIPKTITSAMAAAKLTADGVAALIFVHCGGRRGAIDARIEEVTRAIRQVLEPGTPFISYMTFGEQGVLADGTNVHGTLLLSALVVGK